VTYRLEIRPEVFADIEKAERWYDEREPNLGADFVRETIVAIETLSSNPLGTVFVTGDGMLGGS
jgi:hypothetical protein